jgi:hypothetical protein
MMASPPPFLSPSKELPVYKVNFKVSKRPGMIEKYNKNRDCSVQTGQSFN